MEPEFWHERWRTGQIGFHQSSGRPQFARHWPRLRLGRGKPRVRALVRQEPRSALAARSGARGGRASSSSATAVEAFCMENGLPARRTRREAVRCLRSAGPSTCCRGDFFAPDARAARARRRGLRSSGPDLLGAGAAGCLRRHLAKLLSPGHAMLLITLEYPQSQMAGPPFSVHGEEVDAALRAALRDPRDRARGHLAARGAAARHGPHGIVRSVLPSSCAC